MSACPRLSFAALVALAAVGPVAAESVVSTRMLTNGTVITSSDISLSAKHFDGAISIPEEAIGRETRRTIYAGRPLTAGDIGPAAEVHRNDTVQLRFSQGALRITTEGRALDRGARGERISIMNLASRIIVYGRVAGPGIVEVSQ